MTLLTTLFYQTKMSRASNLSYKTNVKNKMIIRNNTTNKAGYL